MELHAILDSWCEAAAVSAEVVERIERGEVPAPSMVSISNMARSYTPDILDEIEARLMPKSPLMQRWKKSNRQQASRRTLRSMMRIYCPDLLETFEQAIEQREYWAINNGLEAINGQRGAPGRRGIDEVKEECLRTQRSLEEARDSLAVLIREKYPLEPPSQ